MNIQVYWDGNVGACEYEARKGFYTTKPVIPTVTFDTLVYSEDDNVATKLMGNTPSQLTSQEIVAVKQFANANSSEVPSSDTVTVDKHNNDPEAHHDIRVSLSTLNEYAHQVASVWSTEVDLVDLNKASLISLGSTLFRTLTTVLIVPTVLIGCPLPMRHMTSPLELVSLGFLRVPMLLLR